MYNDKGLKRAWQGEAHTRQITNNCSEPVHIRRFSRWVHMVFQFWAKFHGSSGIKSCVSWYLDGFGLVKTAIMTNIWKKISY